MHVYRRYSYNLAQLFLDKGELKEEEEAHPPRYSVVQCSLEEHILRANLHLLRVIGEPRHGQVADVRSR
jgi:hypothetical protein